MYKKNNDNNPKISDEKTKKVIFVLVAIFAVCFFFKDHIENPTIKYFYNLYFFVVDQTLGIVHESGHGVCYILPCPRFIMVINGTVFQLLFPWGVGYYYLKRGNKFGYYLGLFFLGISLSYTAWYIGTSHEGAYVPASKSFLGIDGYHDFHYILSQIGLLAYDGFISALVKIISVFLMLKALLGLYVEAYE
jgi:hypothetical protein